MEREEMFLEEDINSNPDEVFEAEQDIFDIEEISDTISTDDLNTDLPVEENKKYSVSIDFSSRFDCFEYEPDAPQYDSETICAELIELDNKHPEKQILKICELKYYQKKSITEIADILNISTDTVLETLNEIIDVAKEQ